MLPGCYGGRAESHFEAESDQLTDLNKWATPLVRSDFPIPILGVASRPTHDGIVGLTPSAINIRSVRQDGSDPSPERTARAAETALVGSDLPTLGRY